MSDTIIKAPIGNTARILFAAEYADTSTVWNEILNVSDITLPEQTWNTVDLPSLNQTDGITCRIPGTRNGGDMSFTVGCATCSSAPANNGLIALIAAKEAKTCGAVKVVFSDNTNVIYSKVFILGCEPSAVSNDTALSYSVSAAINAKAIFGTEAGA